MSTKSPKTMIKGSQAESGMKEQRQVEIINNKQQASKAILCNVESGEAEFQRVYLAPWYQLPGTLGVTD